MTESASPSSAITIWPGTWYPLGATYDGRGCNFSVFSEVATRVELCLFDDQGREQRVDLPECLTFCWHGYVPGLTPGQRYGFRVHGPWDPGRGHRCNPDKLLLDPYAKAIEGVVRWDPAVFPFEMGADGAVLEDRRSTLDSAAHVPRSVVVDPAFDWGEDRRPKRSLHQLEIYELHVKGFTARMPQVPPELRGTYAGLAHPASLEYLTRLGVSAVELMPVHQFVHDGHLVAKGLRNYWGYNSIGFFAPHNEYASVGQRGEQVREFKEMVKALHASGIEVILDVVYNHTGEGNHVGPVLCFKGLDNRAYYRVMGHDGRLYMDYTGTGNSLNMRHPHVLQLLMDSLRYWVLEMHVDGFRFDLAATLARELHEVDRLSAFFDLIHQDPVVSQVKLIAEPWDVGEGGYQVGNFPALWSEWNGKYRDTVRDYWRGADQTLGEFAHRLTGSPDLYAPNGRRPLASVNFVCAHDGFTLLDLVSYSHKHNEANGEDNKDGESHNRSWNHGEEGPTDDPAILAVRARQQRNFLATLLLSQGVPMILAGDELGRTQAGNNNAYCQDNELSWIDWERADQGLLQFTASLLAFRRAHPVFRRRRWFQGQPLRGQPDIAWFTPGGQEMSQQDWSVGFAKSLTVFLNGQAIPSLGPTGEPIVDDTFLLCFNAHYEPMRFTLPDAAYGPRWQRVIDTVDPPRSESIEMIEAGGELDIEARALIVLQRVDPA
ncbi:MAG: glycogen debranching protein GlgX [Acidobacteriota bacterium]